MDRFTWGVVGGAIALCILAVGSVFVVRKAPTPSLQTPAGVVTAFVQAVQDRDTDRAWDFFAPNALTGSVNPTAGPQTSREAFRQQMANLGQGNSTARAIRILSTTQTGEKARVTIEVTTSSGGPLLFGGEYRQTLTFDLMQVEGAWKIETAPSLYQIG